MPDFLTGSSAARARWEATWRGMIERDGGHPSIVVWCMFIESWGLGIDQFGFGGAERRFADDPETQRWVEGMYRLGRSLDPTRPIIENSVSEADHTVAEVNDTHLFPVGYGELQTEVSEALDDYVTNAFPGSTHNFAPGWVQDGQPLMVTSMAGWSSVDGTETSWPMRVLVNEVRARDAIAGYGWVQLYDVEWELTGLAAYDRRLKAFGYDVTTLHADDVLVVRGSLARTVHPGEDVQIDVALAHGSGKPLGSLVLLAVLSGLDGEGRSFPEEPVSTGVFGVAGAPGVPLAGAISVRVPTGPFAGRVAVAAVDDRGGVVARTEVLLATVPDAAFAGPIDSAHGVDAQVGDWRSLGPAETAVLVVDGHVQRVSARSLGFTFQLHDTVGQGALLFEVEAAVDPGAPGQTLVDQPTIPVRILLDRQSVEIIELPLLCADTRGVLSVVFPVGSGSYGRWIGVGLGEISGSPDKEHELRIELADPDLDARVVLFGPGLGSVPAGPRIRRR